MLPFALVILLEVRSPDLDLTTAAQASPRPRECHGAASSSDGWWLRMQAADAQRYCELLARGYARLLQAPKDALLAAQSAEALSGAAPAVRVLNGRAQLRLGQPAAAFAQFELAEAADARAFADPKALHDYARAASLAGKPEPALRAYRLLVSRLALLDDPRERAFCLIEAAAQVLGNPALANDEALGYLAQARKQPLGLSAWIEGLRKLAAPSTARAASGTSAGRASLGPALAPQFNEERPLLPAAVLTSLRALLDANAPPASATGEEKPR